MLIFHACLLILIHLCEYLLIHCVRRGFSIHCDTTIYILKTKVAPDFLGAYNRLFLSLSLSFSMWILYAGVSKTQEDTLQVFIIKIEYARITGDRNS